MKKAILAIIILLFITSLGFAQDPYFAQFYASPLYLAPSFSGSTGAPRVIINYRDQWPGVEKAYLTYAIGADFYLPNLKSGLGLQLIRDQKGELNYNTTSAAIDYAYHIRINKTFFLSPGLYVQYNTASIDLSKLVLPSQNDGYGDALGYSIADNYDYFDFGTSMLFAGPNFWLGAGVDHLLQPAQTDQPENKLALRMNFFGSWQINFRGRSLRPKKQHVTCSFHYRQMAQFKQLDIGVSGYARDITVGGWYRGVPVSNDYVGTDAFILLLGYSFRNISFGYTHDFSLSGLAGSGYGANEVSLIVYFDAFQPRKKRMAVPCPKLKR
jgi:type IX secretion system PorP/SprF family membrane protein